ncbi:hypothetical protein CHLRE_14g633626v5 [Chlamydomonas reinhardtii]|uniref:Secreted protein n=1 Tax=Chlamydomonas reinhardtii TaxID=3055 RepID=A0A2K3CYW9_CHLRE|nr:uncharacterized protein CHLRE_14g633626v5 [Chlamydomonas reinhardtii]PNW73486.1 hypothetical protein CHLRE_14g633626v5 [Chlamydomonas reinhardtii]
MHMHMHAAVAAAAITRFILFQLLSCQPLTSWGNWSRRQQQQRASPRVTRPYRLGGSLEEEAAAAAEDPLTAGWACDGRAGAQAGV